MLIKGLQCERIAAPLPFITLEDAKEELSLNHDLMDGKVEAYVAAACAELDGPQTVTATPFREQGWRVYFRATLGEGFIPIPRVNTVQAVARRSRGALTWQLLDPSKYSWISVGPGFIINIDEEVSGVYEYYVDAVFGSGDTEVPEDLKIAAKLRIRQLFMEAPDAATEAAWNRITFNYGG